MKRRNNQLITICKQLKLTAKDGKSYLSDVVDDGGVNILIALFPGKNWSKINKWEYLEAMRKSPVDSTDIFTLIKSALTDEIDNREIFLKGIDYSYYYEENND